MYNCFNHNWVEVRNSKVEHIYRADPSVQKGVSPKRTVLPQNTVRWGAVKYAAHCHGATMKRYHTFNLSYSGISPIFAKKVEALYFGFFVFTSPNEKHFRKDISYETQNNNQHLRNGDYRHCIRCSLTRSKQRRTRSVR